MSLPPTSPEPAAAAADPADDLIAQMLAAIRAGDGDAIAASLDRLGDRYGIAAAGRLAAAVSGNDLTEAMLGALEQRAAATNTAIAWAQLAAGASALGRVDVASRASAAALERDPAQPEAALMASDAANRRGEHDVALRVIANLTEHVPAAKDDPNFIVQIVIADLGRKQPEAALATVDAALPRLTAASLTSQAHVLRARALGEMPERLEDAVSAWTLALAAAQDPLQTDGARDGLIAALWKTRRFDECLRQIDEGVRATANPGLCATWLDARPHVLAAAGDIDGALHALEDLLSVADTPLRRIEIRLRQARTAASATRWEIAADRFDDALSEIAGADAQAADQRLALRLEKARTLANVAIDRVRGDLDTLDAAWSAPGWPAPIDFRVTGLIAANRADEAHAWLEARMERSPALAEHPAAWQLRADIEIKRRNTAEGLRHYARAVEIAPGETDPRALGAALMGAYATQQWHAGTELFRRIQAAHPFAAEDPMTRVIAAVAYLRHDDPQTALALTEGAEPPRADMAALRDATRAESLVRLGRYDEALASTAESLERYARPGAPPVAAEFLLSLHTLRAQTFNQRGEYEAARASATAAIEVPDEPSAAFEGLTGFVRLGAYMQRSLAAYKLEDIAGAQRDIDAAIEGYTRLHGSAMLRMMEQSPEFGRFESSLWYAKGAVLDAENRSEEALAAYTRAERLETQGNTAAVARGYALMRTGAYPAALEAFDTALDRADGDTQRGEAFAGRGRALLRVNRFEDAIAELQAALDARLTKPDNDPGVFELLGIAYNALGRNGAALRAFRRAWTLTPEGKRTANLARGVTAAELRADDPEAALKFLAEEVPAALANDRTLLFNRALALDAVGQRRVAIRALVKAKDAGLDRAQEQLDRLDAPAGLGRWTHYWFGGQASRVRRAFGVFFLAVAAMGVGAPLLQWWLYGELEWYLMLLPSAVALVLLALPNMKSITIEAGKVKLSGEPLTATGREAAAVPAPETFKVPMLTVSMSAAKSETD